MKYCTICHFDATILLPLEEGKPILDEQREIP